MNKAWQRHTGVDKMTIIQQQNKLKLNYDSQYKNNTHKFMFIGVNERIQMKITTHC